MNVKIAVRNIMDHPRTIFAINGHVNYAAHNLSLISIITDARTISTNVRLNDVSRTTQTNSFHLHKTDILQKKAIMNLSLNSGFGILKLILNTRM